MSGSVWLPYAAAGLAIAVLLAAPRLRTDRPAGPIGFLAVRGGILVVMALVLALLTDAAAEGDGLTAIDRPIWSWLIEHRTGTLTTIATAVSDLGGTGVTAVLAVVVAGALALRHRLPDAGLVLAVTAGAGIIVLAAKPVVGRVRPPAEFRLVTETNQSFPSGHAVASAAVLGVLAAVLVPLLRSGRQRTAARILALVAVLAIGVSRLYLGVHWSTDVIGGWLAGSGWLLLCLSVHTWWFDRPARVPAAAAPTASHSWL